MLMAGGGGGCHIKINHIWRGGRKGRIKERKPMCIVVRGEDRDVTEGDAFRGRIHTAGVHKEVDRPYT